jgi:hypothetical protein
MIFLSTLLIGLVCSTSLPQTALVNAAQGDHQIAQGTQIVPQDIIRDQVLPYLDFNQVLNLKNLLRYSEEKIIKLFAESQPAKVAQYILRDLDNPQISNEKRLQNLDTFFGANSRYSFRNEISILIANGKVDLLRDIMIEYGQFYDLEFDKKECLEAAKNGHVQMVEFILDWSQQSDDLYHLSVAAIEGSLQGNQFQVFQIITDSETYIFHALEYSIRHNALSFVQYCIQKIEAGLMNVIVPNNWYHRAVFDFVMHHYGLVDINASFKTLEFLLNQREWNPTISGLLQMMVVARETTALKLLARELLRRPSLTDEYGIPRKGGSDALDAAIRLAKSRRTYHYLVETLQELKALI